MPEPPKYSGEPDYALIDDLLTVWAADPVLFARECLGMEPWDHPDMDSQVDILRAPLDHKDISVRSGHKCGKSLALAAIALWFYVCHDTRVVLVAPTMRQIVKASWFEIRRFVRRSRLGMDALYADLYRVHGWSREEVDRRGLTVWGIPGTLYAKPDEGLRDEERGAEVFGIAADSPDAFSGVSGARVAYLADEANGIAEPMYEALEGNRAGGSWLMMTGNPTQTVGQFYESQTIKCHAYRHLHMSSELVAERINPRGDIKGLASPEWIAKRQEVWGPDSMRYDVRARGNFPQSGLGVIRLRDIEQATRLRDDEPVPAHLAKAQLFVGVDVADQGDDDTVITARRGGHVFPQVVAHGAEPRMVCGLIVQAIRKWMVEYEGVIPGTHKPEVRVDEAGMGSGIVSFLREEKWLTVIGVNNANKPYGTARDGTKNTDLYDSVRSQLWFEIREFFTEGGTIPPDTDLRRQLLAPEFGYTRDNQYRVDSKDVIKKKIERSPDHAESLGYCVLPRPPDKRGPKKPVTIRGL